NKIPLLAKINKAGSTSGNRRDPRAPATRGARDQQQVDKNTPAGQPKKPDAKNKQVSPVLKAVLRPLMAIRKFRLNYGENMSTTVPGFMPQSRLLGLSKGFAAPGWSFVAGLQPNINRRADQDTGDFLA